MQTKKLTIICLAAILLASCAPATAPVQPILTPSPGWMATNTFLPTQITEIQAGTFVEPYHDVRFADLTNHNLSESLIETLWFNQSTKWPEQYKNAANNVLKLGMNPGLGVQKLHAQGLTGKGVNVAIIDQNMVLDHPEFQGKIVKYFDVGTNQPADESSMHGPAVTSLLVGENIGTAPDANVYYVAAPSWTADAQYYADALNWIVDENKKLPAAGKIRAVSISAAPSGPGTPFTKNNAAWDAAFVRAMQADILILDCTSNHGITAPCYYDLGDPDNIAKCTPGWPGLESKPRPDRIYIPTSYRTTAEEYNQGDFSYQYTGRGGLSWSIPYLTGVLALGWQVRPDLTSAELLDALFKSAYVTNAGLKIINPPAFIDMLKQAKSK